MKDIEKNIISKPTSILECISINITDELLKNAKIAAYMFNQDVKGSDGKKKPFAPKNFPNRAVDIIIPVDDTIIEIFIDPNVLKWDSKFRYNNKFGKLSIDQMDQFFSTQFYKNMIEVFKKKWPLSNEQYASLFNVVEKMIVNQNITQEDLYEASKDNELTELEHRHEKDQPGKRKDLANTDINGDKKRDYSGSGRRIIHNFGDTGVQSKSAQYYCWPKEGKEFKWNTWKEWKKQKPLCKMTFKYNNRNYMISLSIFDEQFDNRGFRGADTDWKPPFAWLTPEECNSIMKLSITNKFLRHCKKRIKQYISMDPEEILKKIDKPDKVDIKEIEKTIRVIKHVVSAVFEKHQADNYKHD